MANVGEKQEALAELYDNTTGVWEELFGEHMHEGYYEPGATATIPVHRAAQVRMIDEALRFANVSDDPAKKPKNMLDVGCGLGATCMHVASKYDIQCKGITISPKQVKYAQDLAAAQGLESKVSFDVGDAVDMPYPDGEFDVVFSIDCIDHVQDKEKFIREMVRVAAPGAAIVIVTFTHRNLSPSEQSLKPQEIKTLKKICDKVVASSFSSTSDYVNWLTSLSLKDIKTADWTPNIIPFFPLLFKVAFSWKGFISLLMKGGWSAIKLVLALKMMYKATNDGLLKYSAISCQKPK